LDEKVSKFMDDGRFWRGDDARIGSVLLGIEGNRGSSEVGQTMLPITGELRKVEIAIY
jgi:hypothetical protein